MTKQDNVKKFTGLNRDISDKFYTRSNIVDICIKYIKTYIKIDKNDLCIEPSAGNGSFINEIKKLSENYIFYDIEPHNDNIIKQDYLTLNTDDIQTDNSKIHVIGNPPFGRQSSIAIKFIKKSCKFCDSISFILPRSFKKDSLKKHFPLNFHLIFECVIPDNSFTINNNIHNVKCIFQIWIKKNIDREELVKYEPEYFKFVNKNDNHDISFRRVGVYSGKIDKNTEHKSTQSHYFIKFDKIINLDEKLILELNNINFNCKNDTCGPKSISKQELIKEYNEHIKRSI